MFYKVIGLRISKFYIDGKFNTVRIQDAVVGLNDTLIPVSEYYCVPEA